MFSSYKKFLICWWYEKDIWGYVISKHKTINLAWIKVWPNVENVPHLAKKKWLLQDFSKRLANSGLRALNFSFEIIWRMKKKWPRKMKNWMWFFFLTKILWMFYGNLKKQKFKNFCNLCIAKKTQALFFFLKILEFWAPMFIYWIGLASSLEEATELISRGFISVNNKNFTSLWNPLKLYDFITFDKKIWSILTTNLVWTLYYASKSAWWWKCISSKLWSLKWISRAHFIALPEYVYMDTHTLSIYWWKQALPSNFKFYFSVNLANILKYVTL